MQHFPLVSRKLTRKKTDFKHFITHFRQSMINDLTHKYFSTLHDDNSDIRGPLWPKWATYVTEKHAIRANLCHSVLFIIITGTAIHTVHACQMIGMPECDVILAQCVVYLARAEKSREIANAVRKAQDTVDNHKGPQPDVPLFIKDTSGQRKLRATLGTLLLYSIVHTLC